MTQRTPSSLSLLQQESTASAQAAGLRYFVDIHPGIRRLRRGTNFSYRGVDGRLIRDPAILRRIKSLVIPPAWTDVWICPDTEGHLQATGRDSKRRKQYRYHPQWRIIRDETKYDRLLPFAQQLPRIRQQVERDVALPGLPRDKVLATVVYLLDMTQIRIGNAEYARTNQSYGLTTMHDRHVKIDDTTLRFQFRGKSGKKHTIVVSNRRLATIVRRCQGLPGHELFQYVDKQGQTQTITSGDVNAYLHLISGRDFTAKDFRTWAGTLFAARTLKACGTCTSQRQLKRRLVQTITQVAERLGNTVAVCRRCYIHPAVLQGYVDGSLLTFRTPRDKQRVKKADPTWREEEAALVEFLQEWRARSSERMSVAA